MKLLLQTHRDTHKYSMSGKLHLETHRIVQWRDCLLLHKVSTVLRCHASLSISFKQPCSDYPPTSCSHPLNMKDGTKSRHLVKPKLTLNFPVLDETEDESRYEMEALYCYISYIHTNPQNWNSFSVKQYVHEINSSIKINYYCGDIQRYYLSLMA